MLYLPTPQEIIGSLPPGDRAELFAIIGRAAAEEAAETGDG